MSRTTKPAEAEPADETQTAATAATAEVVTPEGADAMAPATPASGDKPAEADPAGDIPHGMAKVTHPDGATSCSFDGEVYEADKKGVITVPLAAVAHLEPHGFKRV